MSDKHLWKSFIESTSYNVVQRCILRKLADSIVDIFLSAFIIREWYSKYIYFLLESPVHVNDYTHDEWRILNDIYDDVFPASHAEDNKIRDSLVNDSHSVIVDSKEGTPIPSPSSGHDFNFGSSPTEDPVKTQSKESTPMPLLSSGQDSLIQTTTPVTDNHINIPSINSLISSSDNDNPLTPTMRKRKATYKTVVSEKYTSTSGLIFVENNWQIPGNNIFPKEVRSFQLKP